jgi:hypothetical protein
VSTLRSLRPGEDLAEAVASAPDGAVVRLTPGTYGGTMRPTRSLTIIADPPGEAVVDADGAGPCLVVDVDDIEVRVHGVALTGGAGAEGGAVTLTAFSRLDLEGCRIAGNHSRQAPGGGALVTAGTLALRGCTIEANEASDGLALCADAVATVQIDDCTLTGAVPAGLSLLRVRDGAAVSVRTSRLEAGEGVAVHVSGTTSRAPEVVIEDSALFGHPAIEQRGPGPGLVEVRGCHLSTPLPSTALDLGGNLVTGESDST